MAKIFGQLENAQLENKASDYSAGVAGRAWWNTTSTQVKVDDGSAIRAMLRNDGKLVVGNSGTAADNIRLHRGAAGVLQFLSAADSTAEGSLSAALNQLSARLENYTNAGKPSFGNAGRVIWVSDLGQLQVDTGSAWTALASGAASELITADASTGNKTIAASTSLFHPYLTISAGHTYTVNGHLVSAGTLSVAATGVLDVASGATVDILD